MKRLKVFYPVLIAIFPVLAFFGHNAGEVPFIDLVLPLIVVVVGALTLLFSLRLVIKDHGKIAIIVAWLVVLFFSYGYIRDAVFNDAVVTFKPNIVLLSVWLVLAVVVVFLILRTKWNLNVLTRFLCITSTALVVVSLVSVGVSKLVVANSEHEDTSDSSLTLNSIDDPPDIYYIILDSYASEDSLKELLDYDNSKFIDYLTSKGFYVATKSHSSYSTTFESLSDSLNMSYRDSVGTQLGKVRSIANSRVSQLLKSAGYRYIYVSGGVLMYGIEKYAKVYLYSGVFGIEVSDFIQELCDTTALSPLARFFGGLRGANSIMYAFDTLAKVSNTEEPMFVYSHIECPHFPYYFTADGSRNLSIFRSDERGMDNKEGYLDNLEFVNKKVKVLIDTLLAKSDVPPIIILQGDHGVRWTEREYEQRLAILNAYYLPNGGDELLYETISPVNTFRVVFNYYFDADYELLEDYVISTNEEEKK